jgi:hypothetical protein
MILFKPWEKRGWVDKNAQELKAYKRSMVGKLVATVEVVHRSDSNFRVHVIESFVKSHIIPSIFIDEYEDIEMTQFSSAEEAKITIDNILLKLGCKLLADKELNLL